VLVKKDSSKIQVKLLEVRTNELKYKLFSYQDGPDIIISKKDVAYVIYSNGAKEIFNSVENPITDNVFVNPTPPKGSVRKPDSIGNYIKFNIQVATVVYNSFSNLPRRNYLGMTSSNEYKEVSAKQNVALNFGINFLFGKSPYVKHVLAINYLKTKSEYYNDYGSIGYSYYAKYKSEVDFVNLVTGIRLTLFKKIHIEPLVAINFIANSKTTRSGTETHFDPQTPPYTRYTSSFENEPTQRAVETTFAFTPKISYELPIKKIKIEAYAAYNLAFQYRLPWYQFGVHIFPFKKLK
jgi:hypothetical protein